MVELAKERVLSVCQSVCVCVCMSLCLYVCLSVCMSFFCLSVWLENVACLNLCVFAGEKIIGKSYLCKFCDKLHVCAQQTAIVI